MSVPRRYRPLARGDRRGERGRGLVWIEAQELALAKPEVETSRLEAPSAPLTGPPPEVIFTDPGEGEADVPLKSVVRLQFSRDMNPETFKGRVFWRYVDPTDGTTNMPAKPEGTRNSPPFRYNGAKRSLEVQIDADALARCDVWSWATVAATALFRTWKLTFIFGARDISVGSQFREKGQLPFSPGRRRKGTRPRFSSTGTTD